MPVNPAQRTQHGCRQKCKEHKAQRRRIGCEAGTERACGQHRGDQQCADKICRVNAESASGKEAFTDCGKRRENAACKQDIFQSSAVRGESQHGVQRRHAGKKNAAQRSGDQRKQDADLLRLYIRSGCDR